MRILFLSQQYPPDTGGGLGGNVASNAAALTVRGHEVHVLSCAAHPRTDVRDGEVWVHRRGLTPLRRLGRLVGFPSASARLDAAFCCLREYRRLGVRFDVIQAPDWRADGLLLAGRVPMVANLHTPVGLSAEFNRDAAGLDRRAADRLERTAVARADLVTSISGMLAGDLRERGWLRRNDVRVVPMTVDVDRWRTVAPVGTTGPLVLAVGRVEPRKGPDVLVKAAARLAARVPELEVVFVGRSAGAMDGLPFLEWVRRLAGELGAPCRFVDHVPRPQLAEWYGRARVVCSPSRYDAFSMSALEAMASGRPLVCTSRTGAAELLDAGGAGAVVPPDDPEALTSALAPYLLDAARAAAAGTRAAEVVEERCSPPRVAAQREACYLEAIERWRRRKG